METVPDDHATKGEVLTSNEAESSDPMEIDPKPLHSNKYYLEQIIDEMNLSVRLPGLYNLGNTCYLNAAVQCLLHTPAVFDLLTSPSVRDHINRESKITRGEVAEALIDFVQTLRGTQAAVSPSQFKKVIGRFDERWRGVEQHDAHEFLSFLVNTVHDDLNRVRTRPTVNDNEDEEGEKQRAALSDHALAEKAMLREKLFNDSFITERFQGLFKSELTCPSCKKTSTKFDPFLDVSLPIPSRFYTSFAITCYAPLLFLAPKELRVTMKSSSSIGELLTEMRKALNLPDECGLVLAQVYDDRFVKFFLSPSELVSSISYADEICAFIVTALSDRPSFDYTTVPVMQVSYSPKVSADKKSYEIARGTVNTPFIVSLPRSITTGDLRSALLGYAKTLVAIAPPSEADQRTEASLLADAVVLMRKGDGEFAPVLFPEEAELELDVMTELAIAWCPKALAQGRLKRVKATETIDIAPHGSDAGSELTLRDCFDAFAHPERLTKDDCWYCPHCKEHKQALKKMDLWALPPVLVVHLKRFEGRGYWAGKKITKRIQSPVTCLDLGEFVKSGNVQDARYELVAVAVWPWASLGHYTAVCKAGDGAWHLYDDESVSVVAKEEHVITDNAYLLIYVKKGA